MISGAVVRNKRAISLFGGDVPTLLYSDPARGGDGQVRLNPQKANVKWQWVAAAMNGVTPINVATGATRKADLTVSATGGDEEGDFEVSTIMARAVNVAGAGVRVAIQPQVVTPTINRFLSNQPISAALLAGTSQLPGVFLQAIYCLPDTAWKFDVQNLSAAATDVTIALQGRRFQGCSPCNTERLRRRAQHLQWFHPYWIGPQDPSQPAYTGPEVTLGPGRTAVLTFPVPSDADFLMFGALDDSSSSGGGEPSLYANVTLNDSKRGLIDLPAASAAAANASQLGISWRDFLAVPTITAVTGFQLARVPSYGLANNELGGITHLVPRNTQVVITFISTETVNTITLRPALFGLLIYGRQPADRQTSIDGLANRERIAQGEEFLRRMGLPSAFGQGRPE